MNLLLDTHIAIWAITEPHALRPEAAALIANLGNDVIVSAVSVWEIALKFGTARRGEPPFSADDAVRFFSAAGYQLLPVTADHARRLAGQPRHHADPFDRILVAQAEAIGARLITRDRKLQLYGDIVTPG